MTACWDDFVFLHVRKFAAGGLMLAGLLGFLAFGGCGDGTVPVTGTVTNAAGAPVVVGTVTVLASDNQTYVAPLRPDGSYTVSIPPGPFKVAVVSPNPKPQYATTPPPGAKPGPPPPPAPPAGGGGPVAKPAPPKAVPKDAPGGKDGPKTMAASSPVPPPLPPPGPALPQYEKWFPIPQKYADPSTSGVAGQAARGGTQQNIRVE